MKIKYHISISIFCLTVALTSSLSFGSAVSAAPQATEVFSHKGSLWSFAFISQQELLISMREGKLLYYNLKTKEQKSLLVPNVSVGGQGGLLDVHFVEHKGIQYVYLTYSTTHKGVLTTALDRAVYTKQNISQLKNIFVAKLIGDSTRHFGSRLAFKPPYIFMTIGDRGVRDYALNLSYHNGKILRLTMDGAAAKGNPFEQRPQALPEIWSYGHRNPQGIDFDPVTGKLFSCEFGPRGGDELNAIGKGLNYGWPAVTYGKEYNGPVIGVTEKVGTIQPIKHWIPSISPSGMAFYTGDKTSAWKNHLFLANLGSRHLLRLELKNQTVIETERLFEHLSERIRHVRTGPDGYLYFSTDSGKLMRVH